jgi:hypothetical protein
MQVSDARADSGLRKSSGVAAAGSQFLDLLNEVQRRLIKRGGFYGLEQTMTFCLNSSYITWPQFVGTILGVRFLGCCGGGQLAAPYNNWYSFTNNLPHWRNARGYAGGDTIIEDAGTAPCYNDVTGTTGKYIVYHVVNALDIGKTITLYGKQYGGQPLQTTAGGITSMGQTLTAAQTDVQSPNLITELHSVTRQATSGMAYLYELDPATSLLHDLAVYQPSETNPRYRRSKILNYHNTAAPDVNGISWFSIEALVKLQFVPLVNNWDFLLIDDFDALNLGFSAVKLEEANDSAGAEVKWAAAIRELNMELRDKFPDQQTSIRVRTTGSVLHNPI